MAGWPLAQHVYAYVGKQSKYKLAGSTLDFQVHVVHKLLAAKSHANKF